MIDAPPDVVPVRAAAPSLGRRLATLALASLVVWCAAVGALWWYLERSVAAEYRMDARPMTDPDSYGLPLFASALALAAALLVLNGIAALVLVLRRKRRRLSAAPLNHG